MPLTAGTIKWHSYTLSPSPGSKEGASFLLLYSETSNYCERLLNKSTEQRLPPPPPVLQQLRPMMVLQQPKKQNHQLDSKNKVIWIWKSETPDLCQSTLLLSGYKHVCCFNPYSVQAFIFPFYDYQSSVYKFRLNELVLGWSVEVLQKKPKPQKRSVNTIRMIHSWATNWQVVQLFWPGHNCWGHMQGLHTGRLAKSIPKRHGFPYDTVRALHSSVHREE